MSKLIDMYNQISVEIQEIHKKIKEIDSEIEAQSAQLSGNISVRIEKLEAQIEKIDEYLLKVRGFQELAKKYLTSQNVLMIEAPEGYRVNLNRLRNWSMMIDPTSSNDPYAQKVLIVSKCDEFFLENKRKEFSERIQMLKKQEEGLSDNEKVNELTQLQNEYKTQLRQYAHSDIVQEFSKIVIQENNKYWFKTAPELFRNPSKTKKILSPGSYAAPFSFEKEQRSELKTLMGDCYDENKGRVFIPVEIDCEKEYVMAITCSPNRRAELDRGLQNLVFSTLNGNPVGSRKVYVYDAIRYNSSSMRPFKELEDSVVLERIPKSPDSMVTSLESLTSYFMDMDDHLEYFDSVTEYNASVQDSDNLQLSTLILYGWPKSFDSRSKELIERILKNYERYGVSIITVNYEIVAKDKEPKIELPEFALINAIKINMQKTSTSITMIDGTPQRFKWYTFEDELSSGYTGSLLSYQQADNKIGNEYTKRYSLVNRDPYQREYKPIELPFGVDTKDNAHSISFEHENFATYLVGASRSGKSTLLHTLIAGLIRNYHPDNLELWLADFKQLEFKRYMKHLPPHVKYILLDESQELVFDLIDKLTAEMMERQKLFAKLGVQRIDQVNVKKLDKPLPVLFVILDEFSIMSQSIAESDVYKLRLQNILAKGAALGIKFLFSSQTFTTGVAGLSLTARAQIQQRISMKGSKEEISSTLELSANLKTEQVNNWMDALPPHYALVKFRQGPDTLPQVKRFLVMYFEDYKPRDVMIDNISASMIKSDTYNTEDNRYYLDKKPVLVDGNTYDVFSKTELMDYIRYEKTNKPNDYYGDERFISFGTPRLMDKMLPALVSTEACENFLLVSREIEQACTVSIILSSLKSFAAQGTKVKVWAYDRNKLYRSYKSVFEQNNIELVVGTEAITKDIARITGLIKNRLSSDEFIVIVGLDRIRMDFEYSDGMTVSSGGNLKEDIDSIISEKEKELQKNGVAVSSSYDDYVVKYQSALYDYFLPYRKEAKKNGATKDEIRSLKLKIEKEFNADEEKGMKHPDVVFSEGYQPVVEKEPVVEPKIENVEVTYDDLVYSIKQGSRLGYHFMVNLSSYADIKTCGLKHDFFRYTMAFQQSVEDSRNLFNSRIASSLPEHICQFSDTIKSFSFRPYLHQGIGWDGWYVDENGNVINPYENEGEEK